MKVIGIDGMTQEEIYRAVEHGAKFVVYQYCVSVIFITYNRTSNIYFVRPGHTALLPRIGYSLLSLLLGWWSVPWGPIRTTQALWHNAIGGRDLTPELVSDSASASNS